MTPAAPVPDCADDPLWPAPRRAWYVAIVLMLANTCAFVDRQALALVVQPIQNDLGASDTQMGLLYGLGFTLLYLGLGIPLARVADRSSRTWIVTGAILWWSAATAACGFARSFTALFAARLAVGAGEAGLSPAAYSLLSDYFPRHRLAAAMGVYQMGIYVGGGLALVIGGALSTVVPPDATFQLPLAGAMRGWQLLFVLLGIPGLFLAALMLSVREPHRRGPAVAVPLVTLRAVLAHIGSRPRAYFGIGFGFALMVFVGNATGAWIPTLLSREYGWSTSEIGVRYGLVVFGCGTVGALSGGFASTFFERRSGHHGSILTALIGFSAMVPLSVAFPLVGEAGVALALIGVMNFFAGFSFGGGHATLQHLTPNRMRARTSALYLLLINIFGGIFGPTTVALMTDYWFADPDRLPEAIALICSIASPLALLFLVIGMSGLRDAAPTLRSRPFFQDK
ncbi:MFS transporter [Sphingomonas sp. HF-S3]|uniref:MFS transporter n=1 Tax=Sphingomonas rustica TaxID=3103142 RepID=A0ABV0B8A4_9SPHN